MDDSDDIQCFIEEIAAEVAENPGIGRDDQIAEHVSFVAACRNLNILESDQISKTWKFNNRNPHSQLELLFKASMNRTNLSERDFELKHERIKKALTPVTGKLSQRVTDETCKSSTSYKIKKFLPPLKLPTLSIFSSFSSKK